jgi:hypothetical protein
MGPASYRPTHCRAARAPPHPHLQRPPRGRDPYRLRGRGAPPGGGYLPAAPREPGAAGERGRRQRAPSAGGRLVRGRNARPSPAPGRIRLVCKGRAWRPGRCPTRPLRPPPDAPHAPPVPASGHLAAHHGRARGCVPQREDHRGVPRRRAHQCRQGLQQQVRAQARTFGQAGGRAGGTWRGSQAAGRARQRRVGGAGSAGGLPSLRLERACVPRILWVSARALPQWGAAGCGARRGACVAAALRRP